MAWGHVHNIRSWGKMSGKDLYICRCLYIYRHAKEKFEDICDYTTGSHFFMVGGLQ